MKKRGIRLFSTMMFVSLLVGCGSEPTEDSEKQIAMEISQKENIVEYGETIPSTAKNYLLNNDEEFLKSVKVNNLPKNEKDKNYPAVGEYKLTLKSENEEQDVIVVVKDTVAPTLEGVPENYELEFGIKFDISKIKIETTDLSDVTVTYDDSSVHYEKSGDYTITVSAIDEWGNKTVEKMTLTVKPEKKKEPEKVVKPTNDKTTQNSSSHKPSTTKPSSKPQTPPPSTQTKGEVYWVPKGKSYHSTKNCPTLSRSKTILSGSLNEAISLGKSDPCDRCH